MRVNRSIEDVKNFFNFTGKVAVITGGSGGFGKAAAIGLAAYGADVVITSRKLDSLEDTAEEIRKLGRKVLPISCDVGDEASINAMIAKVIEELGKIDILITAAGIANRFPAEEFPIDEWQNIMDINVKGTFLCCQAAGKQMMKQGGGKIITVSSVRGLLGHPGGYAAYGTSKGAVSLLTRQLAVEWAKYNINVNSIAPCIFWTPLTKQVLEDEQLYTLFMERIPMGRAAEPEDFIGSVLLLSSGASDMITGHILYVDGGNTAG